MPVLVTCKFEKDMIKNNRVKGGDIGFPIISQWVLSVAMETSVLSQSVPKPYAALMIVHIKFDQDWPTGLRDIQVSSESLWQNDNYKHRMTEGWKDKANPS